MIEKPWKRQLLQMLADELEMELDAWIPRSGISKKGNLYITIILKDLDRFLHEVRTGVPILRNHYRGKLAMELAQDISQAQGSEETSPPNLEEYFGGEVLEVFPRGKTDVKKREEE